LVVVAAAIVWNYVMSKLERWIENKVTQALTEEKMKALQPTIVGMLNERLAAIPESQLRQPSKPLFANIEVLTTVDRSGDEDDVLMDLNISVVSVAVSTEPIDKSEHSRVWMTGGGRVVPAPQPGEINFIPRAPRDLVRTTFSAPLSDSLHDEFERQDRARRQQAIIAELAREATKQAGPPPPPTQQPQSGPAAILPAAPAPEQSFLPGAPREGPHDVANRWLKTAEAKGWELVRWGTNIAKDDVQAFLRDEKLWRLMVDYQLNWSIDHAPGQPVQDLKDLLKDPSRPGQKLDAIRARLQGS
jgi:hypothetical protein